MCDEIFGEIIYLPLLFGKNEHLQTLEQILVQGMTTCWSMGETEEDCSKLIKIKLP